MPPVSRFTVRISGRGQIFHGQEVSWMCCAGARVHKNRNWGHGQHAGVLHAAAGERDGGAAAHDRGNRPPCGVRTVLLSAADTQRHAARTRGRRAGAGSTRRSCTCSASRPHRITRCCEQSRESMGASSHAYSHAGYPAYKTQTHSASTWVGAAGTSDNMRERIRKVLFSGPAKCIFNLCNRCKLQCIWDAHARARG